MQHTTNYNLNKPEQDDAYDIDNENENMDTIDTELKNLDTGKISIDGEGTYAVKKILYKETLPENPDQNTLYLIP